MVAAIGLAALAGMADAATLTYNLTNDWQNNSNPNGAWTYAQGSSPLPYQPNLGSSGCFGGQQGITGGYASGTQFGGDCIPAFIKATGNSSYANSFLAGDVLIHSQDSSDGAGQGQATLIWTAPVAGTISFSGAIWYAQFGVQRSNDFSIILGSTTLETGTVAYNSSVGSTRSNMLDFSSPGQLNVTAGETLDFVLRESAGQSFGSYDGLQLGITETTASSSSAPEPSAVCLLAVGIVLVGSIRMRKSILKSE